MKNKKYLSILIFIGMQNYTQNLYAEGFDTSLLVGKSKYGDISRFYIEDKVPEGKQLVDIYVNQIWKGQFEINISGEKPNISLDAKDVNKLGLNLSLETKQQIDKDEPILVDNLAKGVSAKLDINNLRLDVIAPQISVKQSEVGYVDASYWQQGISALILAYNINYYNYKEKNGNKSNNENFFANINAGVNLGSWQFRDESNYSYYSHGKHQWKNNTRYIYKALSKITAGLTIGDFYTPAALFNSISFRGISLSTEMGMLPNSSQGFAPIIRGVAQTNALVSVYQNENLVFQENVPPGEFSFRDIQPTAGGGDLVVVIQEADGRRESFTVPFSAVPDMLKEGVYRYNVMVGESRINNTDYRPKFAQGEIHYGVNNLVTVYAGGIVSEDYYSALIGSGWNFKFGAISADITHASADLQSGKKTGQSFRLAYSKYMDATLTNLTLAAYRYSTSNYYSFVDSIYSHDNYQAWKDYQNEIAKQQDNNNTVSDLDLTTFDALRGSRAKNTFTINLNQYLGGQRGAIFLSGTHRNYWNTQGNNREYQLGYSNNYKDIAYNFSVSKLRNYDNEDETRYYLNVSVPISFFDKRANINTSIYAADSRYQQSTLSLSGTAGKDDLMNYTLTTSNQTGGNNLVGANVSYRHPYSTLSASYTEANDYRQGGLGTRGTIVAIPNHIVFSGDTGKTYTIIDAPMANNMMVNGNKATLTNNQGVVLVANTIPYRTNTYTLTNTEKPSNAEMVGNITHVTPYLGAVNYLTIATDQRQTFIIKASLENNESLPFGTEVLNNKKQSIGYVGQSGVLYLKSDTLPSSVYVKLNLAGKKECVINNLINTMDVNRNICR
ncbi:MAG TPA: usher protein FimD [Proteus sp.]|nr:usher protein FimD [Proteus sp. (in: enterobacteria)]